MTNLALTEKELSLLRSNLTDQDKQILRSKLKRDLTEYEAQRRIYTLFPNEGPLRRELYPKHIAFFAAGGEHSLAPGCPVDCNGRAHQERAFIAANRIGKTTAAAFEIACHTTGYYPDWWPGRRFNRPVTVWACGEDTKAVRESLQPILVGPPGYIGTGMIPADKISNVTARPGVPDGIDAVTVKHPDGSSRIVIKTYDQRRESFQGAKVDLVWFDEEPPIDIYSEGLTRTMSTVPGEPNGLVLCTFTPLKGISDVVLGYLPDGKPIE